MAATRRSTADGSATWRPRSLTGAPFGMHAVTDRHCVPSTALCRWFARWARSHQVPLPQVDGHGAGLGVAAPQVGVGEPHAVHGLGFVVARMRPCALDPGDRAGAPRTYR